MKFLHGIVVLSVITGLMCHAEEIQEKRKLKPNMELVYQQMPKNVEDIADFLSEGILYGRFRLNTFLFKWQEEIEGKRKDHYTIGVGGSLVYKSAYYHHVGFTLAGYTSQNPWHMDDDDAIYYRPGKGVLSRYDVLTKGEYGLNSLAQAYMEYKDGMTSVKVGRQIFESRMTKSNDIKMVPNTFEGISMETIAADQYMIKAAYMRKQKLRDHTDFHHLFAFDDGEGTYDKFLQNDDAAMHKGITLSKLESLGIDDRLWLFEIINGKQDPVSWLFNYTLVPELFSSMTLDLEKRWNIGEYTFSSAVRYMHQFDHGAGVIGGPNLWTKTVAYKDLQSVEANLYGIRVDMAKGAWKVRAGMTYISDDADIISPWRAFPTGGFSHALLQYNWYANTKTYMVEGKYTFTAYDASALFRYANQNFDDAKPGVQADSNILQLDLLKQFRDYPGLYTRVRMAIVHGDKDTIALDGTQKLDPAYKEIRFELNYLF